MSEANEQRYKARLRMLHIGIGGSPETFEAIWAAKKRREALTTPQGSIGEKDNG